MSLRLSHLSRTSLGASALALALGFGTLVPFQHSALAEPVRIEGVQQAGFGDVVEQVAPAVVSVRVKSRVEMVDDRGRGFRGFDDLPENHPFRRFFDEFDRGFRQEERERGAESDRPSRVRPTSQGSGFFISEDGYLVTNNHVIEGGAEFTVVLDSGTELEAKLIGADPRTDLAVLKVDADRPFTYVAFADDGNVRVGDWVVAVGNPFGLGGTVTAGIVSGLGRDIGAGPYSDFIQIDAAVNRGNSGGPAFNLNGEVIGVNTAIFSPSGGNVGIAFAIQASTAQAIINDLLADGRVTRGYIGVRIQPVSGDIAESIGLDEASGALVASVEAEGPAGKAGIRPGDVIVRVGDQVVATPRDLSRQIAAIEPGATTAITVFRNGEEQTLSLELGELGTEAAALPASQEPAAPSAMESFGLDIVPAPDGDGLEVVAVDEGGVAAEKGIRSGDIIRQVNGEMVKSASDLTRALDDARELDRRAVLVQVDRDGTSRFLALPIDQG